MNDAVLDLQVVKQPLRALMYEKLIWTQLLGIDYRCSFVPENTPDTLRCAVGDQPNVCIQMSKGIDAVLPFGIMRRPSTLYVYIDTPAEFVDLVGKRQATP